VRDLDQRLLFWSQGAARIYGWTAEEAVGAKTTDLFVGQKLQFMEAEVELRAKACGAGRSRTGTRTGARSS